MIKIRLAEEKDLDAIISIEEKCFPREEAATSEDIKQRFSFFMDCFVVAELEEQGNIVGFINGCSYHEATLADKLYHKASLHEQNGYYQMVFGLDVLAEYRHQGIGEQLIKYFIQLAIQRHKKGMVLTCKDYLLSYYEKFGFVKQGVSSSNHGGAKWNDMLLIF